ncbi:hypothetical protein OQ496_03565, partial [Acetobacter suratthaniensis]
LVLRTVHVIASIFLLLAGTGLHRVQGCGDPRACDLLMRDLWFWFNVSARKASIEVNLAHECVFCATLCGKHLSLTKHPTYMQASIFNAGGSRIPWLFPSDGMERRAVLL